jgi:NADPH:quinone reductase
LPIPDSLTYLQAAAIPEVFVTAHEALIHLGKIKHGDWVLIHGAAGGVGSAAVALAHAIGAKVIYTASGADRIGRVAELGGTVGVDYKSEDFHEAVMRATNGRGVDVVLDFIGGPYLDRNVRSLVEGGRLIQVGALGGSEGVLSVDTVIHKRLRIIGTVMKSRPLEEKAAMISRFRDRWLNAFATGALVPIVDQIFALEQAADAHRAMEASGGIGKIILSMQRPAQ